MIAILSFYSFTRISDKEILVPKIYALGIRKKIRGTIVLAGEGFNGSITGSEKNLKYLSDEIIKLTKAREVNLKINYCEFNPFHKLKVKIKPEIVALKAGDLDVENLKGDYVEPKDWDKFISRDDVVLIDTRNNYEIEVGTFKGSVNPNTDSFREFPQWAERSNGLLKNKKIAMCCTGGIRCEKSTSYLKTLGYKEVYHLKGGILQYLEDTKNSLNLWEGECFVFDDRVAVDGDLKPTKFNYNV